MNASRVAIVVGASALACGVIELAQPPSPPVNTCNDNAICIAEFDASIDVGAPVCVGSACAGGTFRPIIIVSVPLSTPSIGGNTIAISEAPRPLKLGPVQACNAATTNQLDCTFLTPLISTQQPASPGYLRIAYGLGVGLWPPGLRPNQKDNADSTLPVDVAFHPMWADPASGNPLLATKLGLPLEDVLGVQSALSSAPAAPTDSDASASTTNGVVFFVPVPQALSTADPGASYLMEIVPSAPFDVFPPYVSARAIAPAQPGLAPLAFDLAALIPTFDPPDTLNKVVQQFSYTVQEAPGAPSLTGWRAYVIDSDGHRISGRINVPSGTNRSITLYQATGPSKGQANETLFIDPPPGVDLPSYASPAIGSIIQSPFLYPALPAAESVSGFVEKPDGTKTTARITFVADGTTAFVGGGDGTSPLLALVYKKATTTTPLGQYLTTLPPGVFRAYAIPDDPTLALTTTQYTVTATSGHSQSGRPIPVNPRTHVKGRVVLGNGTPLFGADVVVGPSADAPFTINDDVLARPREAWGTTDVNGAFDVLSDPGAVDISIRPQDGTQFPWVVLTHRIVPPATTSDAGVTGSLTLASNIVIPLPSLYSGGLSAGVLVDSNGSPIPHAVIRAYAFPALATPPDGGTPQSRGARLIGETTTDDNATFQLFVAPPAP